MADMGQKRERSQEIWGNPVSLAEESDAASFPMAHV